MRGELRDQCHRAVHARHDGAVARLEIRLEQRHQRVQRILAGTGRWILARKRCRTGPGRTGDDVQAGLLALLVGRSQAPYRCPGKRVKEGSSTSDPKWTHVRVLL